MNKPAELLVRNRAWVASVLAGDANYFKRLAAQQAPQVLWIGCSDSRVPANVIAGLDPGEVFVHRNVGNIVVHTDLNCLSVLQFAVDVLRVKHVIVVGHYGCGGIRTAYDRGDNGLIDNWLRNIQDVHHRHRARLDAVEDRNERLNLLCELNVMTQVAHVCRTTIAQNAWARGQPLAVHGWVYSLADGQLKDLDCTVDRLEGIPDAYRV